MIVWPDYIDDEDGTLTLMDIVSMARDELEARSNEKLTLVIQEVRSEIGNNIILHIHLRRHGDVRTIKMFSIVHPPDADYPASFMLRDGESSRDLRTVFGNSNRRIDAIDLDEFKCVLKKVLKLQSIKNDIIRLLSFQSVEKA
jgi:hypothetical protein